MTVSNSTNRWSYDGDGEQTVFQYLNKIYAETDLKVYLRAADGSETLQELNVDYTVAGAGADEGGEITCATAPGSTEKIILKIVLPMTQETALPEAGLLPTKPVEDALDRNIKIAHQLQEQLDRTVKLPESTQITEIVLPEPVDGKYLRWNGSELSNQEMMGGEALDQALTEIDAKFDAELPGAVAAEVTSQLPAAVTTEVASQLPAAVSSEVASQVPSAIAAVLPEAVADEVDADLPALVTSGLNTLLPPAVAAEVASELPGAVATEVASQVPSAVATAVPSEVASEISAQLPTAVTNAVDAIAETLIPDAVDTAVAAAVPPAVEAAVTEEVVATIQANIAAIQGQAKQLKIEVTGNTALTLSALEAILRADVDDKYKVIRNITLNMTDADLDAGSLAASTWYGVYLAYNPTTGEVRGLLHAYAAGNPYQSEYPPVQSGDYVKATTTLYNSTNFAPWLTTDPSKSLIGTLVDNQWNSGYQVVTNQRFHIDLGEPKKIERIYYEPAHHFGDITDRGAKNFTLWGSNDPNAFADTTYDHDTGWTQIGGAMQFDQHIGADQADPKYITVNNIESYRYYCIKIADNWGSSDCMALRRLVLQTKVPGDDILKPVLPSGFTFWAHMGWVLTDASVHLIRTIQNGNRTFYKGTGSGLPTVASGSAGAPATPTWVELGITGMVPPTAVAIILSIFRSTNSQWVIVAPNNSFGAKDSSTNLPFVNNYASGSEENAPFEMGLEGDNIYWASGDSGAKLFCYGWVDNR